MTTSWRVMIGGLLVATLSAGLSVRGAEPTTKREGPLILAGGRDDREGSMDVLRAFVSRAGGGRARVVLVTQPGKHTEATVRDYRAAFGKLSVGSVDVLHLDDRTVAESERAVEAVGRATGVYFTGGSQWRFTTLVAGTRFEAALRSRRAEGLVIAGTSAGAAAMPGTMLSLGTSGSGPRSGDAELEPGLGLIGGVIVDTHFAQRGRLGRLLAALAERPGDLGIGIDEETALVLDGDRFEVVGKGTVTVLDATALDLNDRTTTPPGAPLALAGVRLHTVPAGYTFDLKRRAVVRPGGRREGQGTGRE
jgi:cyanophycinase